MSVSVCVCLSLLLSLDVSDKAAGCYGNLRQTLCVSADLVGITPALHTSISVRTFRKVPQPPDVKNILRSLLTHTGDLR